MIQVDGIAVLQRVHYLMIQLMRECVVFDTVNSALIPAIGSLCIKCLSSSNDQIDPELMDSFGSFLTGVIWMIDLELETGLDLFVNTIKTSIQRNTLAQITKSMVVIFKILYFI